LVTARKAVVLLFYIDWTGLGFEIKVNRKLTAGNVDISRSGVFVVNGNWN
jgi:hypothetical protein